MRGRVNLQRRCTRPSRERVNPPLEKRKAPARAAVASRPGLHLHASRTCRSARCHPDGAAPGIPPSHHRSQRLRGSATHLAARTTTSVSPAPSTDLGKPRCASAGPAQSPAALSPRPPLPQAGEGETCTQASGAPRSPFAPRPASLRRQTSCGCCSEFIRPRQARAHSNAGAGAESFGVVTAAAPRLVRVRGQILRPATNGVRANPARLGLRMTDTGAHQELGCAPDLKCTPSPTLFVGEGGRA